MARKADTSAYQTFDQITDRLDEIVDAVRSKDTSLERSLDLFDEAIDLGSKAVDLVDTTEFSPREKELLESGAAAEAGEAAEAQAPEAAAQDGDSTQPGGEA